jgi:hypothetical protein
MTGINTLADPLAASVTKKRFFNPGTWFTRDGVPEPLEGIISRLLDSHGGGTEQT